MCPQPVLSFTLGVVFLLLAASAQARSEGQLEAGMVNPGYHAQPDWFKTSFLDIREDVEEAAAGGRRVMLYFYQDGCPYCKKLIQDNFGQAALADKTRRYFDTVAINMWGDREVTDFKGESVTEKQFAVNLKVMFTPTLLMLDESGAVVLRINGYYPPHRFEAVLDYAGGGLEKQGDFRAYLARRAPVPASGRLHVEDTYLQPPYRLAARDGAKPLLVLFEQRQCSECDELHQDILKRETSRELLQAFDVVLLDMWSKARVQTPAGETTTAGDWARSLDVNYAPSMIFFDTNNRVVFRTDGLLKAFHVQSVLDYVASQAYLREPEFQRYIDTRADRLRARGIEVELMK